MKFDTKLAVVVREDLPTWQKLNVTAFTVSGIAGTQDVLGEPYVDGSGVVSLPMVRQPILIFAADRERLRAIHAAVRQSDIRFTVYTEELFATGHDAANRAAVRAVASDGLDIVGLGLYGRKKPMDKVLKGVPLHR
ncbi:MAG: DUF2000 family protein [Desulfovibrionaceae bacterium]|jgi:hypothetical protein|nr:DUF2000 family protein [Desulfovibrionaceae bacterium]